MLNLIPLNAKIKTALLNHHYSFSSSGGGSSASPSILYQTRGLTVVVLDAEVNEVLVYCMLNAVLMKIENWQFLNEQMKIHDFEPIQICVSSNRLLLQTAKFVTYFLDSEKKSLKLIPGGFHFFFGKFALTLCLRRLEFFNVESDEEFVVHCPALTFETLQTLQVHGIREDGHMWFIRSDLGLAQILFFKIGGINYDLIDVVAYLHIKADITAVFVENVLPKNHVMTDSLTNFALESRVITPVLHDSTLVTWLKDLKPRTIVYLRGHKVWLIEGKSVSVYEEPEKLQRW